MHAAAIRSPDVKASRFWRLWIAAAILLLFASACARRPGDLIQIFQKPFPSPDDEFGNALATMGDHLIVGAWKDNSGASAAGAVYVFDIASGNLLFAIPNPDPRTNDLFGRSVAATDDEIVVGDANKDDGPRVDSGVVYVFLADGKLLHVIKNPDPVGCSEFGREVARAGKDAFIVGAVGNGEGQAAYLYSATTGQLLRRFGHPANLNEGFGVAVAGNSTRATIGSFRGTWLYDLKTGEALAAVHPQRWSVNAALPTETALLGDNLLIGAPFDDEDAPHAGAVFLYSGADGKPLVAFRSPMPAAEEQFGFRIAAVGSQVAIGSGFKPPADGEHLRRAFLFEGATGKLLLTLRPPESDQSRYFGQAITAYGNDILISGDRFNGDQPVCGVVYLFKGCAQTSN